MNETKSETKALDVVIVGAGFGGLKALYEMRELGLRARVYEAGDGVGGTWYWNRYPGARCDVESMQYSYQFSDELQQDWEWSERYAAQPEILRYLDHVADRFDLRKDIQLETRVESAHWQEEEGVWRVRTSSVDGIGDDVTARFLIMATGCLSQANFPDIPGQGDFEGAVYHTGRWPHEGVDFTGLRVGVIGTGSSGIQSIPEIARQAAHLTVFQRTPNWTIPAHNAPLPPEKQAHIKADYAGYREKSKRQPFGLASPPNESSALAASPEQLRAEYERRWAEGGLGFLLAFVDLLLDERANDTAKEFIREKIREQVDDPATADLLTPDTIVGCKRLCVDTDYWKTFNRDDVSLVDLRAEPIARITAKGIQLAAAAGEGGGREVPLDAIVFATGFDAMTGALLAVDIRGREGQLLAKKWEAGPVTYLGLMTEGFPNLFTITGPGSPSVLSNMVPSIEQHVDFIADCLTWMKDRGRTRIEPEPAAEQAWVAHVNEVADMTLFPSCNSWYLGANIPGKPRVFMPYIGFLPYCEKCDEVAAKGYEGFATA